MLAQTGDDAAQLPAKNMTYTEMLQQQENARKDYRDAADEQREKRLNVFGRLPENAPPEVRKQYDAVLENVRTNIRQVRRAYTYYHTSPADGRELEYLDQWNHAIVDCNAAMGEWIDTMGELYESDPQLYEQLGFTIAEMVDHSSSSDRTENLEQASKILFAQAPKPIKPVLLENIGFAAYANNDFATAKKAWQSIPQEFEIQPRIQNYRDNLDGAKEAWQGELKQRELDKTRDNPIVELVTNKGLIQIELFEDQAPNHVASFIYLIENNFYFRQRFVRVISQFAVQAGCNVGDGTGTAGYAIADEQDDENTRGENTRGMFRGSVFFALGVNSVSEQIDLNSASSQFMIASARLPELDGPATVMGRVIEGQSVPGSLYKVDLSNLEEGEKPPEEADYLISAKVIKKRNHIYKPKIFAGELPY